MSLRLLARLLTAAALLFYNFSMPRAQQAGLPASWDGVWKGQLTLVWATGKVEPASMELHVGPLPDGRSNSWKIVYDFGDRREVRDCEIGPAEGGGAGRLLVDEKNGFLIDNYLAGDALYSRFAINGNLVTARFELRGG